MAATFGTIAADSADLTQDEETVTLSFTCATVEEAKNLFDVIARGLRAGRLTLDPGQPAAVEVDGQVLS